MHCALFTLASVALNYAVFIHSGPSHTHLLDRAMQTAVMEHIRTFLPKNCLVSFPPPGTMSWGLKAVDLQKSAECFLQPLHCAIDTPDVPVPEDLAQDAKAAHVCLELFDDTGVRSSGMACHSVWRGHMQHTPSTSTSQTCSHAFTWP